MIIDSSLGNCNVIFQSENPLKQVCICRTVIICNLAKLYTRGTQRGYGSKPLNMALLNVF